MKFDEKWTNNPLKWTHWAPLGWTFDILGGCWGGSEAKAMPREAKVQKGGTSPGPGKVYRALRGGTPPGTQLGVC